MHFDLMRTVAIHGEKGTFKDVLAMELAEYYLQKHGYKFFSNQRCVWNDEYFQKVYLDDNKLQALREMFILEDGKLYAYTTRHNAFLHTLYGYEEFTQVKRRVTEKELYEYSMQYGIDQEGIFQRVPRIRHSFLNISEGGQYLREWKYFGDLELLTRKLDVYIAIPCVRPPHVDLCHLLVENVMPFQKYFGFGGGYFKWQVLGSGVPGAEISRPVTGHFVMIPGEVGLYETNDLTTSPTEILEWFKRQIDYIQREEFGRADGISVMATSQEDGDASALSAVAAQVISSSLSVQNQRNQGRKN